MTVTVYRVLNSRTGKSHLAGLDHFELQEEQRLQPDTLLTIPNLSLYSLDNQHGCAVFVETLPDVDLTAAPFYYLAQKEHAVRVLTVPFDAFNALASCMRDPEHLILLYSVGRCGSTLLGKALDRLGGMTTLSEPDIFTHIAGMRTPDGSRDQELTQLAGSATRFLGFHTPDSQPLLIKFRSQGTEMADLLHAACPNGTALFLTRDFTGWLRSVGRMSKIHDPEREASFARNRNNPTMFIYPRERYLSLLRNIPTPPRTRLEDLTLQWASVMRRFFALHEQGVINYALTYDDLIRRPAEALSAVANVCRLSTEHLSDALEVFRHDSQAGTHLSGRHLRARGESELTDSDVQQAQRALVRYGLDPTVLSRLPGNLLS